MDASQLMKEVTTKFGGKGGGRKDRAEGTVPLEHLAEALDYAAELVKKDLNSTDPSPKG